MKVVKVMVIVMVIVMVSVVVSVMVSVMVSVIVVVTRLKSYPIKVSQSFGSFFARVLSSPL